MSNEIKNYMAISIFKGTTFSANKECYKFNNNFKTSKKAGT